MLDLIASHLEAITAYAPVWGFFLIFFFMTVESSFIPFPSEVVMIPAGFLAYRGELTFHSPCLDLTVAILCGTAGAMAGAYINYFLALKLGRPVLYKYGKYFFLKPEVLERSEEIFREYGELATFVCRLLPAIRQLISIPAGLSKMHFGRFSFFTALGAGVWTVILAVAGWYCGKITSNMTYKEMIHKGMDMIHKHYIWVIIGLAVVIAVYITVEKLVMKSGKKECTPQE
jgi:membrane protein DedA with SNARE-associated domain